MTVFLINTPLKPELNNKKLCITKVISEHFSPEYGNEFLATFINSLKLLPLF